MTRDRALAAGYAVLVMGALLAPAVAVRVAGGRGGATAVAGADLLVVSGLVGLGAAGWAARRLLASRDTGHAPADRWLAAVLALALLAVGAAGLPALALHGVAVLPAELTSQAWLAPTLWGAALVTAALAAAATDRGLLRWLARGRRAGGAVR
ncbi:hypothetical protein O2V63_05325 [Modestobacter sp. VKM Ac-2977]|uniref:hypothetical protein n=1 Tax=Modestobacter sp. VKM Ac-2977 TaxID=3004131 RepID=UPI0022AA6AB9|nr:hypothetical protein [Modestobacter sp. VKM Ac-2977]MCZ2819744.1 hypothetical protein [Modestobacter sp. VKM Ac-2977]